MPTTYLITSSISGDEHNERHSTWKVELYYAFINSVVGREGYNLFRPTRSAFGPTDFAYVRVCKDAAPEI